MKRILPIILSLFVGAISYAADIAVHRGNATITDGNNRITLVNGVDYTLQSSTTTNQVFARVVNTMLTGAGRLDGVATNNADRWMVIVEPTNITESVTFFKQNSNDDCYFTWEIIEYTGISGGVNEFVVRLLEQKFCAVGDFTVTSSVVSVTNDSDVVVLNTGQFSSRSNPAGANRGNFRAEWDGVNDYAIFTRDNGTSNGGRASYAIVEFVGQNWNIQFVTNYLDAVTFSNTVAITAVDTNRTFIHSQQTSPQNTLAGQLGMAYFTSSTNIQCEVDTNKSDVSNFHLWIVENKDKSPDGMATRHYSGSRPDAGDTGPEIWTNSITEVTDMNNAFIMGEGATCDDTGGGTASASPRGVISLEMISDNQIKFWTIDNGASRQYNYSVVNSPVASRRVNRKADIPSKSDF